MNKNLIVLAAGLGSRFGGNKQISEVGPNKEILMEYSVYDAIEAGFNHIIFILKQEMIPVVKELLGDKIKDKVKVSYAVQDYSSLPSFYILPPARQKPFGTIHAVLCAKEFVDGPFATINADDYYGKEAYTIMSQMLTDIHTVNDGCMVPFILGNTMSVNGGVTRGVCEISNEGSLITVTETKNIHYTEDLHIDSDFGPLQKELPVSMNFWGFSKDILDVMNLYFENFLKALDKDEIKKECLLPIFVDEQLKNGNLKVIAKPSHDVWFGITYKEDKEDVQKALLELHQKGYYPNTLY